MIKQLSWTDVLGRGDLIGGYVELVKDGVRYCGPVSQLEEKEGVVQLTLKWLAKHLNHKTWSICENTPIRFLDTSIPYDIGQGKVYVMASVFELYTIFPKDAHKFDTIKVRGLTD